MKPSATKCLLGFLALATLAKTAPAKVDDGGIRLGAELWKASLSMTAGGVAAAVIEGNDVTYGYFADPSAHSVVKIEKAIFDIGSITKTFTCLLLAQAVVEHRVSLDDTVGKLLPDAHVSADAGAITLRQLASHTSGLPRLPENLKIQDSADPYAYYTQQDLYSLLATYKASGPLPAPFLYSNLGAGLLGHVLEVVYGKSYNDLIAEKIAGPLHLKDTTVELTPEQLDRLVIPNLEGRPTGHWHMPALSGAGALHSTLFDLAVFAQAMNQGGGPLSEAWKIVKEKQTSDPATKSDVGLGVLFASEHGQLTYWHNGSTIAMNSYIEWTPSTGRAYVILANTDQIDPTRVARRALWAKDPAATPGGK